MYCTSHNFKITVVNVGNMVQVQGYFGIGLLQGYWVLEGDFSVHGVVFCLRTILALKLKAYGKKYFKVWHITI